MINRQTFFRAWLPSFLFWFSIVAGSLAMLMLQYVTGGEWGLMIRRPLGAAARTMLSMLLLFIPIVVRPAAHLPVGRPRRGRWPTSIVQQK